MSMARKRRYDSTEQEADSSRSGVATTMHAKETNVTDAEIDEFFAILKRAQEARSLIRGVMNEKGREVRRVVVDVWQPRFVPEDFVQVENTNRDGDDSRCTGTTVAPLVPEVASTVAAQTRLDLNAAPDETDASLSTPNVRHDEFLSMQVPNRHVCRSSDSELHFSNA